MCAYANAAAVTTRVAAGRRVRTWRASCAAILLGALALALDGPASALVAPYPARGNPAYTRPIFATPVGRPFGVTIGPDGYLYASRFIQGGIVRIDPRTGARIVQPTDPSVTQPSFYGRTELYSLEFGKKVFAVNARTGAPKYVLDIHGAAISAVKVGPNGIAYALVSRRHRHGYVRAFNPRTGELLKRASTHGLRPRGLSFNKRGTVIAIANKKSDNVTTIATRSMKAIRVYPVGHDPRSTVFVGRDIYVVGFGGTLTRIHRPSGRIETIELGADTKPRRIISDGHHRVFLAFQGTNQVAVFDTRKGTVTRTIAVPGSPRNLAYDKINERLYVAIMNRSLLLGFDVGRHWPELPQTNRRAIFTALDTAASVRARDILAAARPATLDRLTGDGLMATQNVALRASHLFTAAIFDQTTSESGAAAVTLREPTPAFLALAPSGEAPERTWRAWGTGYGAVDTIGGSAATGAGGQQSTIYGGLLGVDKQVTPSILVGLAVGSSEASFSVPDRATTGAVTGGHVALYGRASLGPLYGAASASFGAFDNRTLRSVRGFGAFAGETGRGAFAAQEVRTRTEIGRHFNVAGARLTPFVALEAAGLRTNGFRETPVEGPGRFALTVDAQKTVSVPAFVGTRLQMPLALGAGIVLTPTLQAAWVHEFAPYRQQITALSGLPAASFLVDGARPARDAAQLKAGGELVLGPHATIFAGFDGEVSGIEQVYAGRGGIRFTW